MYIINGNARSSRNASPHLPTGIRSSEPNESRRAVQPGKYKIQKTALNNARLTSDHPYARFLVNVLMNNVRQLPYPRVEC